MQRHGSKALAALVLLSLSPGCRSEAAAARFRCDCGVLTDTDALTGQKVEVCARSAEHARELATGCAQAAAPATVQSCRCEPQPGSCARAGCQPGETR